MTTIILFNGPPACGKDTLAKGMVGLYPEAGKLEKFAMPIKKTCRTFYDLTEEEWNDIDGDAHLKSLGRPEFLGQSCRQVQINMSELFAKPTHDKAVFGQLLVKRIQNHIRREGKDIFFISDSGFVEEALACVREFGSPNVLLVRIKRDGCNFDGDSRSYIQMNQYNIKSIDIENNGTVDEALQKVNTFLKEEGAV